ncbi:MAG TPA: universal stress protein [Pyrinomonadaceae bacterium]|nr:universal stress protein [Pyrinomonadaceae bacterium]
MKPMKIVLAVDGSACSEAAVEEVARRPWPDDTSLRVVSAVEPPAPLAAEPHLLAGGYFEEVERLKREAAEGVLRRAAARIVEGDGGRALNVTTAVLKGSPRRAVVEDAEGWGADLIVVGSHGLRTWERMLLGSVSQTVAAHARCSVEIVRCREEEEGRKG